MRYISAIRMGPGEEEEHIALCSYLNAENGKTFRSTPTAIAEKLDGGWVFSVGTPKGPVEVEPVHRQDADDYIRTVADGEQTNNLLKLPRF